MPRRGDMATHTPRKAAPRPRWPVLYGYGSGAHVQCTEDSRRCQPKWRCTLFGVAAHAGIYHVYVPGWTRSVSEKAEAKVFKEDVD